MPLVAYSDSESEAEHAAPPPAKRPRREASASSADCRGPPPSLPPLPPAFLDLYATNARQSTHDDPALHAGRKRAIPHMDGHWPSHVYLEWHPNAVESRTLQSLLSAVERAVALHFHTSPTSDAPGAPKQQTVHSSLLTPLSTPAPLHVSLSRTLPLPTDTRSPFLDALAANLRRSGARPFEAHFEGLKWVPNFDRSRWFLVLGVRRPPNDELNRLLLAANQAAKKFRYPELYAGTARNNQQHAEGVDMTGGWGADTAAKDHKGGEGNTKGFIDGKNDRSNAFHVSLAWSLEPPPAELQEFSGVEDIAALMNQDVGQMNVRFDVVKVKVGNAVHALDIAPKRKNEKGILGLV
ncbi:u6 snrna phosphodiesterase [Diplodia corticola]|uniref:U6 snRNA phosphodiesterase n=1 Tax=Diplodia corticola TaxID=236234 RepID=A0A1J9RNU2_9PEZI|nr:u6 snrna phosphodiesterase [Diplodia corticola]OJD29253.1 u6 snrna phosphodiesterase [Diplodia corticola]